MSEREELARIIWENTICTIHGTIDDAGDVADSILAAGWRKVSADQVVIGRKELSTTIAVLQAIMDKNLSVFVLDPMIAALTPAPTEPGNG